MSTFEGFEPPTANYSKLPNTLIGEMHNIKSVSELKVILYILRHTWGFRDSEKRITNDEFCEGRKQSDGTRLDGGCGLTPKSVRAGLASAVENGYITVTEDKSDLARIKRWYSINSKNEQTESAREKLPLAREKLPSWTGKTPYRTEKETLERNIEKDNYGDSRFEKTKNNSKSITAKEPNRDPNFGSVCTAYEQNIGLLTSNIGESIEGLLYEDNIPAEWVIDAIRVACENEKRNLSYVKGILRRWKQEGRSLQDFANSQKATNEVVSVPNGVLL